MSVHGKFFSNLGLTASVEMIHLRMIRSLVLLVTVTTVCSHIQEPTDCPRLGSVYESMCPTQIAITPRVTHQGFPGKRGAKGERGELGIQGIQGTKGDQGETNYTRVEEIISQRLQKVLDEQSNKLLELSNLLTEANAKIRILENKTVYCPAEYDGKCFWVEVRYNFIRSLQKAQEICAIHGGNPANIYSQDHHYMMMGYLRMFASKDWGVHAWLGMLYERQTNVVLLSNGTRAPFVNWHPGHPSCSTNNCVVYVVARMEWKNKHQHMFTSSRSNALRAVICEK